MRWMRINNAYHLLLVTKKIIEIVDKKNFENVKLAFILENKNCQILFDSVFSELFKIPQWIRDYLKEKNLFIFVLP